MKVILATFGSFGDVRPFLLMAHDIQKHGHEALLIANPYFKQRVEQECIPFRAAGTVEDYVAAATPAAATSNRFKDQGEQIAASRRLFNHMFMNPVKDTCDIISGEQTEDTVVLGHFFAYGAKLAAEKHGLPFANICLSPHWLKGFQKPMGIPAALKRFAANGSARFIDGQLFTKPFNSLRAEYGLGPLETGSARWMFGGQTLCLFPRWFPDFQLEDGLQVDFAGFPLADEEMEALPAGVMEFLGRQEAPIVFTPGSAVTDAPAFFNAALAALKQLGKPGIFLTGSAESIPRSLPENVLHAGYVPLGLLLAHCGAIVHHGGIGTAAQALACGTPQLICHRMDEQRENGRLLNNMGVCAQLPWGRCNGEALAGRLSGLLGDPQIRVNCAKAKGKALRAPDGFFAAYAANMRQK
jgi:UDP:flavonoid glycosyltransferase YjiC (YdhE family)